MPSNAKQDTSKPTPLTKARTKAKLLSKNSFPESTTHKQNCQIQRIMEEEEEEENMSPFWLQTPRHQRRRSSSSSINSGVVVVIFLIVAVAFIFFNIRSFLSFIYQIFRPNSVKKSWDSLNLVLVVFAIVCGFLSRNTGNNGSTATRSFYEEDFRFENRSESFQKSNPGTPRRFCYDHHHNSYNISNGTTTLNRLRSSSSCPDLRREEASWTSRDDYQWRFYDDTRFYNYGSSSFRQPQQKLEVEDSSGADYLQNYPWLKPPPQKVELEKEEEKERENLKNKEVDASMEEEKSRKEVIYTLPPPETAHYPRPLQSEAKVVRRKVRRTRQDLGKKVKGDHQNENVTQRREVSPPLPQPWSAPLPPPPTPPPSLSMSEESGKNEKKRGGTSSTKEFLTSFRRKKKKQRQKSVENLDSFFNNESSYPLPSIPSPSLPRPPPPPPPVFFHNLFSSKKRKAKKIHWVIPTPPPRPPPRTKKLPVSASESKVDSKNVSFSSQKPPLPVKIKSYNNVVEENANRGNESPMNAIPPPPPLPPFKMPAWKFEVHGDFVRLKSTIGEDVEESSNPSHSGNAAATDSGDGALTPLFCPGPDVNTKADNFIARFRAGLRLEKVNSVKEKEERGRSNLESEPSPERGSPS